MGVGVFSAHAEVVPTGGKPISTPMESYAINLVLPKLQNGTKWNVNSLQLEVLLFALILGLLRGMLGRSFLLELPPRARRIPQRCDHA